MLPAGTINAAWCWRSIDADDGFRTSGYNMAIRFRIVDILIEPRKYNDIKYGWIDESKNIHIYLIRQNL